MRSLLIPYILWNILCACLFVVKVKFLNFPGLGIIENDTVNWGKFFEGIVYIRETAGFPYAFAFWFLRDLMVFMIISPLVWIVSRRWSLFTLFVIYSIVFHAYTFGIQWFVVGAALGIHKIPLDVVDRKWVLITSGIVLPVAGLLRCFLDPDSIISTLTLYLLIISGICILYAIACRMMRYDHSKMLRLLCNSTFFIYAFHQCFVTVNKRLWCNLYGCHDTFTYLLAFFTSALALIAGSTLVYLVLRRIAPKLLTILSGGRE